MQEMRDYMPIPVAEARRIATEFRKSMVVILAYDPVSNRTHTTTFGRDAEQKEIAADVYECWQAGAAIAHLHMRDEAGKGSMSKDRFVETVGLIREKCNIVLNLTTSGALDATDETRVAHLIAL